jgi:hypothetical protein
MVSVLLQGWPSFVIPSWNAVAAVILWLISQILIMSVNAVVTVSNAANLRRAL